MIERLAPGDEARVEAFLQRHAATSMFLRSNLRGSGLEDRPEPFHGCWMAAVDGGEIVGVVMHGWNGNLLVQAPVATVELVQAALAASGRRVAAISGPWDQVERARAALPSDAPPRMGGREDLFDLDLRELRVPVALADGRWRCRLGEPGDVERLAGWRHDYCVEALRASPGPDLLDNAARTMKRGVAARNTFVLLDGDEPVATCAYNARLPDSVQIGGVWTPVALRGRGYGRAVVAGSLVMAREEGAERSILFTEPTNEAARRAYLGLGYRIVGDFGLLLF